ncbi:MAG: transcription antitermination factor NusB [Clostridia bacterium]|nr:transcription antitermination factor NusB [Clostridia bacterium]
MNRKTARENAFILLFEGVSKNDETAEEIFEKATSVRELECDNYVKSVFFGVYTNARVIDECIDKCLIGWKKERVSITSKAILRLATYEMMFMEDIPVKVSINEAVELAKKYDDDKAYGFVNGVLNAIAETLGKK